MKSLPVAVIAVLFMTLMSTVFFFPTTPSTDALDMNYTVVVLGGILLLSVIWYYFPKYGGVHWFTGPVPNIDDVIKSEFHASTRDSAEEKKNGVTVDAAPA
ncbi:hypothetical protein H0H87_009023 [Tephrocybe sp. NHM501043]|nr:hypothetical protein H0H87_009023 [Tephrocybe sp. NHM501043]